MSTRVEEIANKREGFLDRFIAWYSKRTFGGIILDPLKVMARNSRVLAAVGVFETIIAKAKSVDHKLKELAQIKAATMIGCPF